MKQKKRLSDRHLYGLMLVTVILAIIFVPILWSLHLYVGVAGLLLFVATLIVQAVCIDPPGLSKEDDPYEHPEEKENA